MRALIKRIAESAPDDFYEKAYEGWYCVGCELFKRDDEIVDKRCVLHPTRALEWTQERNWFFRLSKYQPFLQRLFADRPDFLAPVSRRNEVLSLIDQGLEDISISRARLGWAIPFPLAASDGVPQGTWVWFDALPNYLTAAGYPAAGWQDRWPAQLHVIGKDITRLHAVIWPAMLQAAEIALPERVWAHGFVQLAGERLSKSAGVKLELNEAIDRHGADAFRYFLLREVPFDADGNFSFERFDERYTADLANAFGNLASRVIAMVERYRGGIVPAAPRGPLDADDAPSIAAYHAAMDGSHGYLLHEGLKQVWSCVQRGNEYVDRRAPWKLARNPGLASDLDETLGALVRQLARLAVLVFPFMPGKSAELWTQLGGPGVVGEQRFAGLVVLDADGWRVTKGGSMFPKPDA